MPKKLPTRLSSEPLIDAIFEIHCQASAPLPVLLPGLLVGKLNSSQPIQAETLGPSVLPAELRAADPRLQFAPAVRLSWGDFFVTIGDSVVGVGCKYPYPGWSALKNAILEVMNAAAQSPVIQSLSRCSLKYIDLIPGTDRAAQVRRFNWNIRLGDHTLKSELFTLRLELPEDDLINVVQICTAVSATVAPSSYRPDHQGTKVLEKQGALVDIDTIMKLNDLHMADFRATLSDRLDRLHNANKQMFFSCLTEEAIVELGAEYGDAN
ncbi:TIGR04255 family protein [Ramlibacter ginsenosidimutans]|uniref:TIGR04255 family protein n=1 Tax=Ramlibacter ginsenosidimutans TaxID=502333 RepID=A0A934TXA8_9BURK|nr:TIGR04255 family protein [Ramlibacter ginsenosidimutans]MBK6008806.1 TIGR04255 family protein [Ramlibacter ginsenosidimutans]